MPVRTLSGRLRPHCWDSTFILLLLLTGFFVVLVAGWLAAPANESRASDIQELLAA